MHSAVNSTWSESTAASLTQNILVRVSAHLTYLTTQMEPSAVRLHGPIRPSAQLHKPMEIR